MNHILIAYFSRAGENYFGGKIKSVEVGNTEICAKELKKAIEADLFKIEMKEPYSDNYKKCVAQAMKDMTIKSSGLSQLLWKHAAGGHHISDGL